MHLWSQLKYYDRILGVIYYYMDSGRGCWILDQQFQCDCVFIVAVPMCQSIILLLSIIYITTCNSYIFWRRGRYNRVITNQQLLILDDIVYTGIRRTCECIRYCVFFLLIIPVAPLRRRAHVAEQRAVRFLSRVTYYPSHPPTHRSRRP